jgi:hypothetical protein
LALNRPTASFTLSTRSIRSNDKPGANPKDGTIIAATRRQQLQGRSGVRASTASLTCLT